MGRAVKEPGTRMFERRAYSSQHEATRGRRLGLGLGQRSAVANDEWLSGRVREERTSNVGYKTSPGGRDDGCHLARYDLAHQGTAVPWT